MFSTTCKYAIRATLYLALHSSGTQKLGVDEIAEELSVPKHFLAKILQQLTKHNLTASTKGRNGGFYLTEEQLDESLIPVIECIDGSQSFSGCVLGLPECSGENPCSIHNEAVKFRNGLIKSLEKESIRKTAVRIKKNNFKI